jgi:hypothetical protein
LASAAEK